MHIGESDVARSNDNLTVEWTVFHPGKSVAAISEDTIARPILLSFLISAKSRLIIKVFLVAPGASRNNMPPFPLTACCITVSKTKWTNNGHIPNQKIRV